MLSLRFFFTSGPASSVKGTRIWRFLSFQESYEAPRIPNAGVQEWQTAFGLVPLLKGIPLKGIRPVYLKIKQEEQGFHRDIQNKIAEIVIPRAGQDPSPSLTASKQMPMCRAG